MKTLLSIIFGVVFAGILVAYGVRDEIRLGQFRGSVVMNENQKPLPGASVVLRHRTEPGTYVHVRTIETDENGNFNFGQLPVGSYTVEAYAKAHAVNETVFSVREGDTTSLVIDAYPGDPYLRVFSAKHVFLPKAEPEMTIEGFGQDPEIEITLFKVNLDKVIKGGGLENILRTAWRWDDGIKTVDPDAFGRIRDEQLPIERRDLEGAYVETVTLDSLPSGMYWVSARAGKSLRSGTYIVVSDMAIVTKKVGTSVHVFATHMDSGKALSDVDVSIYQGDARTSQAKTSADGFAELTIGSSETNRLVVVAAKGDERAIVPLYDYAGSNRSLRATLVTDRPIYRPGHEVSFKGIARTVVGSGYSIPASTPVSIEIEDADAVVIKRIKTQTDEFGGFSGTFEINSEAETGWFSINAEILGNHFAESIEVAAYRKPDFEINVTADKPYFVRGERITGKVQADYYFGGAVPEAKVNIAVYRRPHYGEYEEYFSDYEGGGSGEYIGEINGVTNGEGALPFSFDTSAVRDPESDFVYTFDAYVSDDTGRTFDGSGSVRVTRGEFEVSAYSMDYVVAQGEEAKIEIETKSFDGKPLDGVDLNVVYGIESWMDNNTKFEELGRTQTTSRAGRAQISVNAARAGYMVFRVSARDRRGNVIVARPGIYVPGSGDRFFGADTASLSVKMDKREYKLGDTAQAVVLSPNTAQAWVTVEGSDIYISRKVDLVKGGNLIDLKVDQRMLPNAEVTVQYVHGTKFYEGVAEMSVDLTTRKMNVVIEPDKPDYHPGDNATFRIKTSDAATGKPVSADLAFGLVDESIYAIRGDSVDLVKTFYPVRYSSVDTNHSFPEIYLGDGDKDSVEFDVRKRFLDTAYWDPSVVTDSNGEATVSVVLPDNLTTWRATARGLSLTSLAGQGIVKVKAAKPLMVRLGLPRFLTQGDEIEITTTVNSAKDDMDVTISLTATGVELLEAPCRSVRVGPQNPQTIRWRIKADKAGTAEFQALAVSGQPGVSDGMQSKIPVYGLGRIVYGYTTGDTTSQAVLPVDMANYIDGTGELEIQAASSLAATIGGSVDYLVGYPYGCVEQTLSRFIPTLIVSKSPLANSLSPGVKAQLPDMVEAGYARLRAMQHSNGSWGWWEADDGDPRMTGLALNGYALAAQAGRPPEPESRSRALQWSRDYLGNESYDASTSDVLILIQGVAAYGDESAALTAIAKIRIGLLTSAEDWATVALIGHYAGDAQLTKRAVSELKAMAQVNANHASWKTGWYGSSGSAEATLALATITPDDPIVGKAIRYLLDRRRGNAWFSTADTATAVLAIARVSKPGEGGARVVRVMAGGKAVETSMINGNTPVTIKVSMDAFKGARPTVEAEGGKVYYTANWRLKANDDSVRTGTSKSGLSVSRQYFRLRPQRLESGELRLLPSGNPLTSVQAGETVRAVIKINSDREREFMMLEDPLPAGFEVLERSSDGVQEWDWHYWYSGLDIRDDRIVFFMRSLKKGESVLEYTLRAESPGSVTALPGVLSNMYDADDNASTPAARLEVRK